MPLHLSIFHPTGFPTYTLIGWLWSQLPLGEVAWRMNLLSGVCVAGASAFVVLSVEQLTVERHRWAVAGSAAVAGLAFALAASRGATPFGPTCTRCTSCWRRCSSGCSRLARGGARRARAPAAGCWPRRWSSAWRWATTLIGLMAFGIGAWLLFVDQDLWRRWRLVLGCIGLVALGMAVYAYIPARALIPPEPLLYARPNTFERLRYLIFAEQFRDLFNPLAQPFANFGAKWTDASGPDPPVHRSRLADGRGGASILAARDLRAFLFLLLLVLPNVLYSMNFVDGDIALLHAHRAGRRDHDRRRASAPWSRPPPRHGRCQPPLLRLPGRRRRRSPPARWCWAPPPCCPRSLVSRYLERAEQGSNRDADRWVESVHQALPENAVVISWWSYSTPLWYHRWVLGERPDVAIIDERTILDNPAYGTIDRTIESFLGKRPVYLVPPFWELDRIVLTWETETIPTYSGYTDLLHVEGPR